MSAAATPAPARGGDGATMLLHPLVLLNMCDHYQRLAAARALEQSGRKAGSGYADALSCTSVGARAVGILFGTQRGLTAEVFTSFEMVVEVKDGAPVVKTAFIEEQAGITTKIFPTYELLGWYAVGDDAPGAADLAIHGAVSELNESPVFLHLRPGAAGSGTKQLPLEAYVRDFTFTGGAGAAAAAAPAGAAFAAIPLRVESSESERLIADHCTSAAALASAASVVVSGGGAGGGGGGGGDDDSAAAVARQLTGTHAALGELAERLAALSRYVDAVRAGAAPADRALLRTIASAAARVPVDDGAALQSALRSELADSLLVVAAANAVAGLGAVHDLTAHLQAAAAAAVTARGARAVGGGGGPEDFGGPHGGMWGAGGDAGGRRARGVPGGKHGLSIM